MTTRILIVEDQFIEANNLRIILKKAGYLVCTIARSVEEALKIVNDEQPDLVLLDIHLQGELTELTWPGHCSSKKLHSSICQPIQTRRYWTPRRRLNRMVFW
jgi:response regulator of citrate/malate metabolism